MLRVPFSREAFLDVFAAYNDALWPAAVALWLATALALLPLVRSRSADRLLGGLLAVHWAWAAIAYHAVYFARINPAAPLFAGLFLVQAAVFAWTASTRRLTFAWARSTRHALGLGLALYALAYPALSLLLGDAYPRSPTFGVPCPGTLLTAGLLLVADPPLRWWLAVIPIVWAAIGSSAAFALGVRADLMLVPAGALLILHLLAPSALGWPSR